MFKKYFNYASNNLDNLTNPNVQLTAKQFWSAMSVIPLGIIMFIIIIPFAFIGAIFSEL